MSHEANFVYDTRTVRRAVVTGGAGFLGSHLCEHLLARGVEVVEVAGLRIRVKPLEAIDGTPVVDVKPVLRGEA